MRRRIFIAAIASVLCHGVLVAGDAKSIWQFEDVRGCRFWDIPREAEANGSVSWQSGRVATPWKDIIYGHQVPAAAQAKGAVSLLFGNGGVVHGDETLIDSGRVRLLRGEGTSILRQGAVRAIRLRVGATRVERMYEKALAVPSRHDRVLVLQEDAWSWVAGKVETLSQKGLKLQIGQKTHAVERKSVHSILFAGAPATSGPAGDATVCLLTDGSHFLGELVCLSNGILKMRTLAGDIAVSFSSVQSIGRRAGVEYLSTLPVLKSRKSSVICTPMPIFTGRDRGYDQLRSPTGIAAAGIRMHAESHIEYRLPRDSVSFVANPSLVDPDGRVGDCLVRVLCDGQERFRRRLHRGSPGFAINLALNGAERMRIEVQNGEGLDLGDHVIWANARILPDTARDNIVGPSGQDATNDP